MGNNDQRSVALNYGDGGKSNLVCHRNSGNLKSGQGHAFLLLDDMRVLDNRFDEVVTYSEVGCQ